MRTIAIDVQRLDSISSLIGIGLTSAPTTLCKLILKYLVTLLRIWVSVRLVIVSGHSQRSLAIHSLDGTATCLTVIIGLVFDLRAIT